MCSRILRTTEVSGTTIVVIKVSRGELMVLEVISSACGRASAIGDDEEVEEVDGEE